VPEFYREAVLWLRHHVPVSGRQLANVATDTARSIRRRLTAVARDNARRGPAHPATLPPRRGAEPAAQPIIAVAPDRDEPADDAGLDALRGELVRELDRLAAADPDCSAAFRRL
jgi:hypothetical protein